MRAHKVKSFVLIAYLCVFTNALSQDKGVIRVGPTWGQKLAEEGIDTTNAEQLRNILKDPSNYDSYRVLKYLVEHPMQGLEDDIAQYLNSENGENRLSSAIALFQLNDRRGSVALDSTIRSTQLEKSARLSMKTLYEFQLERKFIAIDVFAKKGVYAYVDTVVSGYQNMAKEYLYNGVIASPTRLYAAQRGCFKAS